MELLFITLFIMSSWNVVAQNDSGSIGLKEYLYPSYFWPLDYKTWIREIIESKTVIVSGPPLGITGKGKGYLKYSVRSSLGILGTFTTSCLTNLSKCNTGITIGFWVFIEKIVKPKDTKTKSEIQLLATSRNDGKTGIRIWYALENGRFTLRTTVSHDQTENTATLVLPHKWYHVVVEVSKKTETNNLLNMYVNMKKLKTTVTSDVAKGVQSIELLLGQYPTYAMTETFRDASISIDNIAIWKRILSDEERKSIYVAGFGTIKIQPTCRDRGDHFQIEYIKANDYYSHVTSYSVMWWDHQRTSSIPYTMLLPAKDIEEVDVADAYIEDDKKVSVRLDVFKPNMKYTISVSASTVGGISILNAINCSSANVSGGNQLRTYSATPYTITLLWKAIKDLPSKYAITYGEKNGKLLNKQADTKSLNYTITDLQPNTKYHIKIIKVDLSGSRIRQFYEETITTMAMVKTLKTSIVKFELKKNDWNSAVCVFTIHPVLQKYKMMYNISYREISDINLPAQYMTLVAGVGATKLKLNINYLKQETTYSLNVEVRDLNYSYPGPLMEAPFSWTTKERFIPPTKITMVKVTPNSITLNITLPQDIQTNNITHIKIVYRSKSVDHSKIITIENTSSVLLHNLKQYTNYKIYAASGDGQVFGRHSSNISLSTTDLDECLLNISCVENMVCRNTPGSYLCNCKHGFMKKNNKCEDLNECLLDGECGANMICRNTPGSYLCDCRQGYMKKSNKCEDINECLSSNCGANTICINTPGSFQCECDKGFVKKDAKCEAPQSDIRLACSSERIRQVNWPATPIGDTAVVACPNGTLGNASRLCLRDTISNNAKWDEYDLSRCMSYAWKSIVKKQDAGVSTLTMANDLYGYVSERAMFGGDVHNVMDMMNTLVKIDKQNKQATVTNSLVEVTSSLLDEKSFEAWNDIPKKKRSENAAQLLDTTDSIIELSIQDISSNKTTKLVKTKNIIMKLQRVTDSDQILSLTPQNTIELPNEITGSELQPVTVAMVSYTGFGDLLGVPKNSMLRKKRLNLTINTKVTSVSVFPQKILDFTKPVVIVQELIKYMNNTEPNCVYWEKKGSFWSDRGCNVHAANKTHVTCHCYHLTNFAVLMSVTDADSSLSETHRFALGVISTIGITISLVSLLAAFLTFIFIRAIRSMRNTLHQHLCIALFMAEIIFLFGIDKTEYKIACEVIAAAMHYFFMVSFFIMGLEGIVLYLMLVRVYRSMGTSGYGSTKYVALCWLLPTIFPVINFSINNRVYGENKDYCWLSIKDGFIWSFVGPVLFIIAMNFVIMFMTIKVMLDKAKTRSSLAQEIWFWSKGCCLLLSILGITWVIGIFYVDMNSLFLAYLFNIINSLQGLSIFVFHCVCDPRVRKGYYNFFCCARKRQLLRTSSRTRTTSAGSKSFSKQKSKKKFNMDRRKEDVPLCLNGNNDYSNSGPGTSTPENSFGVLVGTNKF